jgi:hypothetical protein
MTLVWGFGSVGKAIAAIGILVASFAASFRSVADTFNQTWGSIVQSTANALGTLTRLFKGFLSFVLNPVISGLNLIPGVNIPTLRFATGGTVPGYAPGMDVVPALLSPGEGVLRPEAVRALGGPGAINQLNRLSSSATITTTGNTDLASAIRSLVTTLQSQGGRSGTYIMNVNGGSLDDLMEQFRRMERGY